METVKPKIAFIYSDDLRYHCDRLPAAPKRASMVYHLINSYKLLEKLDVVESIPATEEELKLFHSSSYLNLIQKINNQSEDELDSDEELDEFGLGYDCPVIEEIYDFVRVIGGGTVTAAKLLVEEKYKVAINWFGGWHHAQRDKAEGFCYVNDVVIGIQKLLERFTRVLYVDLDVHHGDGVENAFEYSKKVLTLSFHKYSPGFFPGTGCIDDFGKGCGMCYSINVPYCEGLSDDKFYRLFSNIYPSIMEAYNPETIVVQCGADALNGDPIGQCNLTLESYKNCICQIIKSDLPVLFLGGGGYNFPNTARLWTYITATILEENLSRDIPDDCKYFVKYGPSFELGVDQGNRKDCNSDEYVEYLITTIRKRYSLIN